MSGSIGAGPSHINWFTLGGGTNFNQQADFVNRVAAQAIQDARQASSAMLDVRLDPVALPSFSLPDLQLPRFQDQAKPVAAIDDVAVGAAPAKPELQAADLSKIQSLLPPEYTLPDNVDITVPLSPALVEPEKPHGAPAFSEVEMPEYKGGPLPSVPSIDDLRFPEAPTIDFGKLDVSRPEFSAPEQHIYDNNLIAETKSLGSRFLQEYLDKDVDSAEARELWSQMAKGGTGLPAHIEQALFDRAVGREEVSSEQAIRQAQSEWASRGFSLPGTTLLAREAEARRVNRVERGRINRELTIQVHQQEIETLKFVVEQGVQLEGQRFEQHIRTIAAARAIITGSYEVARTLLTARIEVLSSQLQIYQADVAAMRDRAQIELARLEMFRAQIEAERARGEANNQKVQLYLAQLQGIQTQADIYRAEVEGANGLIRAQVAQMELYKERINAYRAEWEGERIKTDAYNSRVSAEQTKAQIFESQVRAYAERVNAYRSQTEAARSQVEAQTGYNESQTRMYSAEIDAWRSEITARIERVRSQLQEFEAMVRLYSADVASEEVRVRAQGQNVALALATARAELEASLKRADQQIEQLRLAETLGMEALRGSAAVNSQLAASAMSAVNVSSSLSDSYNRSNSMSGSWSYSENMSGEI